MLRKKKENTLPNNLEPFCDVFMVTSQMCTSYWRHVQGQYQQPTNAPFCDLLLHIFFLSKEDIIPFLIYKLQKFAPAESLF